MKTPLNTPSIRNTIVAVAAVSVMALPVIGLASTSNITVAYDKTELSSVRGQQRLYEDLKSASRELCGPTDIRLSGSLSQSAKNEKCYVGTLAAAVERLDNDSITTLHTQ